MKESLGLNLYSRWPAVFRGRRKPPTKTLMAYGCEHDDGWYAILDGLCEVLTAHAGDLGRQPPEAMQVKEKWAGLRFYTAGPADEFDHGAISMAEAISFRICEMTGTPGRLCTRGGLIYLTLAPSAASRGFVPVAEDAERPLPPVPEPGRLLAAKWPKVLAGPVELPGGWYDVADVLLACVSHPPIGDENVAVARVVALHQEDWRLVVRLGGGSPREMGMVAFAAVMSTRIDPSTGAGSVPSR
jgi:hypothetical protein